MESHPIKNNISDSGHANVFISYSRLDIKFVRQIFHALENEGVDAWVDWEGIPPSAEWWLEIERAIEAAEAFIFVISPNSMSSDICRDEVAHAIRHNKRLIPIVCQEFQQEAKSDSEVTAAIGRINWIFFRESDDFGNGISRLKDAIETDLEWVRDHSRLLQRAIEWQTHKQDDSYLLQKNDLKTAETWLNSGPTKDPKPTTLQTEYIVTSRTVTASRRRRLLMGSFVAAGLVLLASLIAGWQALVSEVRQEEATSRRLAAMIPNTFNNDAWDLGLLLAVQAYDTAATVESTQALLSSLEHLRGVRSILPSQTIMQSSHEDEASPIWLSTDGKLLATVRCLSAINADVCSTYGLSIYDTLRNKLVGKLPDSEWITNVAFDTESKQLAVAYTNEQPRIRIMELPEKLATSLSVVPVDKIITEIEIPEAEISEIAFMGTNKLVGIGNTLFTWNLDTGKLMDNTPLSIKTLQSDKGKLFALNNLNDYGVNFDFMPLVHQKKAQMIEDWFGNSSMQSVAFNNNRSLLASIHCAMMASGRHCNGELRLLDINGKKILGDVMVEDDDNNLDPMLSIAFSQDGQFIFTGGCGKSSRNEACEHGRLSLWRVSEDGLSKAATPIRTFGGIVTDIAISNDGGTLATISSGDVVTIWNVNLKSVDETGLLPSVLQTQYKPVDQKSANALQCKIEVSFYHLGTYDMLNHPQLRAAAASLKKRNTICSVISEQTSHLSWDAAQQLLAVGKCMTSKDNGICAEGMVTVWSTAYGQLLKQREYPVAGWITAIAFGAENSNQMAIGYCDNFEFGECTETATIELVSTSGNTTRTLASDLPLVSALAWNSHTDRLSYANCIGFPESGPPTGQCAEAAIQMINVTSGKTLNGSMTGHRAGVLNLAFNESGSVLVSGDEDGNIAFWDSTSRQMLSGLLPVSYDSILSLRFDTLTNLIAETPSLSTQWVADPDRWKQIACRMAGRSLTDDEQKRWIGTDENSRRDACDTMAGNRHPAWLLWLRKLVLGNIS